MGTNKMADMYKLAITAGIRNKSYDTVVNGRVFSYSGTSVIEYDGKKYNCIGHGPDGNAYFIYRKGYIEFVEIREK